MQTAWRDVDAQPRVPRVALIDGRRGRDDEVQKRAPPRVVVEQHGKRGVRMLIVHLRGEYAEFGEGAAAVDAEPRSGPQRYAVEGPEQALVAVVHERYRHRRQGNLEDALVDPPGEILGRPR